MDFIIDPVSTSAPHIKFARLRALAVTTSKRSTILPYVPTMQESGFPKYETSKWNVVLAPAGTPPAVIKQLSDALRATGNDEATRKRLAELGVEVIYADPGETAKYLARETAQWGVVIKGAGIKPE